MQMFEKKKKDNAIIRCIIKDDWWVQVSGLSGSPTFLLVMTRNLSLHNLNNLNGLRAGRAHNNYSKVSFFCQQMRYIIRSIILG